ncbi:hypothetical protein RJ639_021118 [Escallonia herrerae]|uniref:Uncharacterized protein n=1 Tax=Escallonia herrerae TaxID=1293975 RepID=A0AA88V5V9_9ASTE|nr:hypothetical protein RJ639_021118 [Escallonia herrerae]
MLSTRRGSPIGHLWKEGADVTGASENVEVSPLVSWINRLSRVLDLLVTDIAGIYSRDYIRHLYAVSLAEEAAPVLGVYAVAIGTCGINQMLRC